MVNKLLASHLRDRTVVFRHRLSNLLGPPEFRLGVLQGSVILGPQLTTGARANRMDMAFSKDVIHSNEGLKNYEVPGHHEKRYGVAIQSGMLHRAS